MQFLICVFIYCNQNTRIILKRGPIYIQFPCQRNDELHHPLMRPRASIKLSILVISIKQWMCVYRKCHLLQKLTHINTHTTKLGVRINVHGNIFPCIRCHPTVSTLKRSSAAENSANATKSANKHSKFVPAVPPDIITSNSAPTARTAINRNYCGQLKCLDC